MQAVTCGCNHPGCSRPICQSNAERLILALASICTSSTFLPYLARWYLCGHRPRRRSIIIAAHCLPHRRLHAQLSLSPCDPLCGVANLAEPAISCQHPPATAALPSRQSRQSARHTRSTRRHRAPMSTTGRAARRMRPALARGTGEERPTAMIGRHHRGQGAVRCGQRQ